MPTLTPKRLFRAASPVLGLGLLLSLCVPGVKAAAADLEWLGADISALATHETAGAVYKTSEGKPASALQVMQSAGLDTFRLRLFVAPKGTTVETNTLGYTLDLAARIKAAGGKVMLDIHYSDTWADPHRQDRPAAWAGLDDAALAQRVESYTAEVLAAFRAKGLLPELVQLGNEITNGLLWPRGRVEFAEAGDTAAWDRLALFLKAAHRGFERGCGEGKKPGVILHIESTGNVPRTRWWLQNALSRSVAFDFIGLSYYPDWHGDLKALRATIDAIQNEFGKPVMVVETAYPWKDDEHWKDRPAGSLPLTREGQQTFLRELKDVLAQAPAAKGLFYWYPEAQQCQAFPVWVGGSCALFDDKGVPTEGLRTLGRSAK